MKKEKQDLREEYMSKVNKIICDLTLFKQHLQYVVEKEDKDFIDLLEELIKEHNL